MGFLEELGKAGIGRVDPRGASGTRSLIDTLNGITQEHRQKAISQQAMQFFKEGVDMEKIHAFSQANPDIPITDVLGVASKITEHRRGMRMTQMGKDVVSAMSNGEVDPKNWQSLMRWSEKRGYGADELNGVIQMLQQFKTEEPESYGAMFEGPGGNIYQTNTKTGKTVKIADAKAPPKVDKLGVYRQLSDGTIEQVDVDPSSVEGMLKQGWRRADKVTPGKSEKDKDMLSPQKVVINGKLTFASFDKKSGRWVPVDGADPVPNKGMSITTPDGVTLQVGGDPGTGGKIMPASEVGKIGEFKAYTETMAEIDQIVRTGNADTGPFEFIKKRVDNWGVMPNDERIALRALVARLPGLMYAMRGKQLSDKELEVAMNMMPQMELDDKAFKIQMEKFTEYLESVMTGKKEAFSGAGYNTGAFPKKPSEKPSLDAFWK